MYSFKLRVMPGKSVKTVKTSKPFVDERFIIKTIAPATPLGVERFSMKTLMMTDLEKGCGSCR